MKRYREKVRDHRGIESRSRELPHQVFKAPARHEDGDEELAMEKPHVLRTETITARTMSVDDALIEDGPPQLGLPRVHGPEEQPGQRDVSDARR